MPPSLVTALATITGNEAHYSILKQAQLVHLDDLCDSITYLFEHVDDNGRHIYSPMTPPSTALPGCSRRGSPSEYKRRPASHGCLDTRSVNFHSARTQLPMG
ncbi:hypothetical protein ACQ4PT_029419 [Festuca glaucescens]